MPRVSVVMPTYNCARYLGESIDSVLDQSYKDLELIVVDGESTDNTDAIAASYAKDPRFVFIKKRSGIAGARNVGIRAAKGEFIIFLDSDDLLLEGTIAKQVAFMDSHKKCGICYANTIYFNTDTKKEVMTTYHNFSGDIFYYLKRNNFIHPSAVIATRKLCLETMYDETLPPHEDWDFVLRIALKGVKFYYIKEVLTKIRVRGGSTTTGNKDFKLARDVVGLKAKMVYWRQFKSGMNVYSLNGWWTIYRYLKFKIGAFLIGFPEAARYNRPVPNELVG
ncbi:MAG: glycosyltransferase [Candidatus Omnitrophica bacterium]|nr:glycosyltransferase [Candidatus Omnitrophota bacterium]